VIDPKDLDSIAEAVADQIVETAKNLGFKPKKKQEQEGQLTDEQLVELHDRMTDEIEDVLRAHWGEEVWAEYEAAVEEARGKLGGS